MARKKLYTLDDVFNKNGTFRKNRPVSNVFVRACAEGDIPKVKAMLLAGEDINQIDKGLPMKDGGISSDFFEPNSLGCNGIQMAARAQQLGMLKLLYENGADPLATHPYAKDANTISFAIGSSFTAGLRYLIDECGYPLPKNEDGTIANSVLFDTMRSGKNGDGEETTLEMIKYLVEEKGIDPCSMGHCSSCPPTKEKTPIIVLAAWKSVANEVFGYFLDKIPTPNFPADSEPAYALEVHPEVEKEGANLLGKAKAEKFSISGHFNDMNKNKGTLLNRVVANFDEAKIAMLLARDADPLYKGNGTRTAFEVLESPSVSFFASNEEARNRIHEMLSNAVLKKISQSPKL